jgi:hypothetical protein
MEAIAVDCRPPCAVILEVPLPEILSCGREGGMWAKGSGDEVRRDRLRPRILVLGLSFLGLPVR